MEKIKIFAGSLQGKKKLEQEINAWLAGCENVKIIKREVNICALQGPGGISGENLMIVITFFYN